MCESQRAQLQLGVLLGCTLLAASCANINPRTLEEVIRGSRPLDETTVVAGLKEALTVSAERGVDRVSVLDGFLGNALIRITMPREFHDVARALRSAGFNRQVDEFEVTMNRAAERAAAQAKGVFWDAISRMTIADAFAILRGQDDAATRYFRAETETELRRRFDPIIKEKMEEVGLYRIYQELGGYYERIPFVTRPALDLDDYVTDRALNGLFTVLAQEEKRIREEPRARSTELLRRVFGGQDS